MPERNGLQGLKIEKGTYVLIFNMESVCRLSVGKLGRFAFPSGWYAYTGSALGPGGLAARLGHHLHIARHPHWHMDYIRPHGRIAEIWYGHGPAFDEHRWSEILMRSAGTHPVVKGFGSSDCRCATHLIHFTTQPAIASFRRRQHMPPGAKRRPVYRIKMVCG